ncbi:MAG: alpha/beta fold hydrolase [Sediminicola sp.]|tara:strand:- start:37641 stop:38411 length:771 start_codon:yes stop_codon:yes gene_type:complete
MEILHSQILGQGQPLIILHGFLGMSDNWKSLGAQYAAENLQAHLIDQRNHGKSFHSDEFDIQLLAADLAGYMAHHQMEKAIVMGHSLGGKTAMQLACNIPELVEKLIVADIAPKYYPPHLQDILNGLKTLTPEHLESRNDADEQLARHIPQKAVRQFLLKNLYWKEKGQLGFRFNLQVLSEKMEAIGANIGEDDRYAGPTLFLKGERSDYITEADLPEIKRHFPLATVESIGKAGHWLHAENPESYFERTMDFIRS